MSFDFDPTSPQQQLDPNPDINDTGLQWWSNETRENAERAVIAARQADMALHVAKTASNMAIAAAGHLIRDNLLANTKMSMRTYSKLMKEPDYVHWDGVLGGRDKERTFGLQITNDSAVCHGAHGHIRSIQHHRPAIAHGQ
ncbi:unnamed protein product [Cladocopium goreaui]|uniref:Uncharacterized protein n=1 Tax=Cladocopium goreaui TaxID=2562237 RepID=A0A9P1BXB1_9DINO|nr:unnamed protein product [Cladocopium goreaui]